jgi:hypothetical protein
MMIKEPESMDDLIFFTNRTDGRGKIKAWAYRPLCPKCKKGRLGKPMNEKGKVAIRAEECTCKDCGFTASKEVMEDAATLEIIYVCPFCGKSGDTTTSYKRKNWQGVPAYIFTCQSCQQKIGITKKMKVPKKKGEVDLADV